MSASECNEKLSKYKCQALKLMSAYKCQVEFFCQPDSANSSIFRQRMSGPIQMLCSFVRLTFNLSHTLGLTFIMLGPTFVMLGPIMQCSAQFEADSASCRVENFVWVPPKISFKILRFALFYILEQVYAISGACKGGGSPPTYGLSWGNSGEIGGKRESVRGGSVV